MVVAISSDPVSPIRPVGSDVTLTCTVELSPAVVVPDRVTVNTVWTGPDGVTLSPTTPVMENLTRYTSTAMVDSFGRDHSGDYNCSATIKLTSSNMFIRESNVETGIALITVGN